MYIRKTISVFLPTRNRVDKLRNTVQQTIRLASNPDEIEVLIRVDKDDHPTVDALPELAAVPQVRLIVGHRKKGYGSVWEFVNEMAAVAERYPGNGRHAWIG